MLIFSTVSVGFSFAILFSVVIFNISFLVLSFAILFSVVVFASKLGSKKDSVAFSSADFLFLVTIILELGSVYLLNFFHLFYPWDLLFEKDFSKIFFPILGILFKSTLFLTITLAKIVASFGI